MGAINIGDAKLVFGVSDLEDYSESMLRSKRFSRWKFESFQNVARPPAVPEAAMEKWLYFFLKNKLFLVSCRSRMSGFSEVNLDFKILFFVELFTPLMFNDVKIIIMYWERERAPIPFLC